METNYDLNEIRDRALAGSHDAQLYLAALGYVSAMHRDPRHDMSFLHASMTQMAMVIRGAGG